MGGAAPRCWDSSQVVRRCLKNPVVHGEAGHRDDFLPNGCSVTPTRSPMKGVCLLKAGRCKRTSLSSEVSSSDRLPPPPHRLRVGIRREAASAPGGRAQGILAVPDPKQACDSVNLQTRWLSEQACHGHVETRGGWGSRLPCAEPAREQSPGIRMLPSLPLPIQPSLKARTEGAGGRAAARGPFCLRS